MWCSTGPQAPALPRASRSGGPLRKPDQLLHLRATPPPSPHRSMNYEVLFIVTCPEQPGEAEVLKSRVIQPLPYTGLPMEVTKLVSFGNIQL